MISSLKKIALDQKVSKLLHSQINEQAARSDRIFTKTNNTPQTTKNINHKSQIKKNLFYQQKENIPEGFQEIQSRIEFDQKEKTIKFVTEKSLIQKKENFQFFFNSNHGEDLDKSILTILKQKQQISELKNIVKDFQNKSKSKALQWEREKQILLKELTQLRNENSDLKKKKLQNDSQKSENHSFKLDNGIVNSKGTELQYIQRNEEDTLVQRMVLKVQRLSEELQYFIELSHKFKNEVQQKKEALSTKQTEIQKAQLQIASLNQALKNVEEKFKTEIESLTQRQTTLTNQLNSYKYEYEVLKKRYFIMQAEFRKYSANLIADEQENLKQKHQALLTKYKCLYESYKSLYEEYINKSRETDFLMQLGESDQKSIREMSQRFAQQGKQFLKGETIEYEGKAMFHLPHQNLNDCSDITSPLENLESQELKSSYHPKIVLKDLIKETLNG